MHFLFAGVLISTTGQLSVIGITHVTYGGDSYVARPVSQLGKQYIVVTSILTTSGTDTVGPYVIAIMATQPNTLVTVNCRSQSSSLSLSSGSSTCVKGGSMTLTLGAYQTAEVYKISA